MRALALHTVCAQRPWALTLRLHTVPAHEHHRSTPPAGLARLQQGPKGQEKEARRRCCTSCFAKGHGQGKSPRGTTACVHVCALCLNIRCMHVAERTRACSWDKQCAHCQEEVPGVVEDFTFKAPKTVLIRLVACAAAAQVANTGSRQCYQTRSTRVTHALTRTLIMSRDYV